MMTTIRVNRVRGGLYTTHNNNNNNNVRTRRWNPIGRGRWSRPSAGPFLGRAFRTCVHAEAKFLSMQLHGVHTVDAGESRETTRSGGNNPPRPVCAATRKSSLPATPDERVRPATPSVIARGFEPYLSVFPKNVFERRRNAVCWKKHGEIRKYRRFRDDWRSRRSRYFQ